MTSILLAGGLAIGLAGIGFRMASRWAARQPDPAWRPTGVRFTTGRTYLQAQGIANALEARRHSASGRRYRRYEAPVTGAVAAAVGAPRRSAEVIQLLRRQA
jgi:hypothetical protein